MSNIIDNFKEEIRKLSWYHPNSSRHLAETLLMQNGEEGSYLMRPSSTPQVFALSLRCKDSVKHYNICFDCDELVFGLARFTNVDEFLEHFNKEPLIAGASGLTTRLRYPYPNVVNEPSVYDTVRIHAQYGHKTQTIQKSLAIGSKEGYLTKMGGIVKSWKVRWFVLRRNHLSYFKDKCDKIPIRTLDLTDCQKCELDTTLNKENCFSLEFSWRTFYLVSDSETQLEEWVKLISWKLKERNDRKLSTSYEVITSSVLS